MTLNITVAARWLMAQSSDFRLTSDSGSILVSDTVQKQVVLHYLGWSGLVCYTGVGRYGVHDTAEWLGQVLHNDLGQQAPGQIVRMLAEKGNIWLHRLRRVPAKDRIHTFTMISFERGNPYIYVISNFERPNGPQMSTPADDFFVTRVRPRGPRCVVTGWTSAITEQQQEELKDVLSRKPEPTQLKEAVARCSREAAARAEGRVSETCVVSHLCPDGSGAMEVYGSLKAQFHPAMIIMGHNVSGHIPSVLNEASEEGTPHAVLSAAWNSNNAGDPKWAGMSLRLSKI